ncbi:MAG TPA: flagellar hook capping FlgD N-terminal domain-containing protein [Syntrophales bacterium]|nr:flagellar hook capping FlgD N-terminal domain-containing protein [Syntrophales bacterium]
MSSIENITGNVKTAAADSATSKLIGKDDFFKMLIAQLKNQDPMNPAQGSEFAAQLAQFSSLEQLSNLNTALAAQNSNYIMLANAQSVNLIGKEVTALNGDGKTTITGQVSAVSFKDKTIYLTVNGEEVSFNDVMSVK